MRPSFSAPRPRGRGLSANRLTLLRHGDITIPLHFLAALAFALAALAAPVHAHAAETAGYQIPEPPPEWIRSEVVGSPSPRWGHATAYHEALSRLVLFGGSEAAGARDTWTLRATTWTLQLTSGPSARALHAMVYDSARNRVVLFGGTGSNSDETWAFSGATWRRIALAGPTPPARFFHAMAYDSDRDRVVLFGGRVGDQLRLGDTWELEGGTTWTLKSETGPSPRFSHALAYDSVRKRVVLFGGGDGAFRNDTWEWDGSTWTAISTDAAPSPRWGHSMVFDPDRQRVILFGGEGGKGRVGDTWEWTGTGWTWRSRIGPTARLYHSMSYDPDLQRVILFGGFDGKALGDTWEFLVIDPSLSPQQILNAILGLTGSSEAFDRNADSHVDIADVIRRLIP